MVVVAFRPVHLVRPQGLANAVGHRRSTGVGADHGELRYHRPNFGVGAQQAAQSDAECFSDLVITHRERRLHVLVGMQAVRIFKMTVAQSAGLPQQPDHFLLCWHQVHC